jgi:predicted house-cleaning noncanonical NTP pyrophosphatase (MazG superfamily)
MKNEIAYNKLVRDKIPEITLTSGYLSHVRTLSSKEYLIELKNKMVEEALELKSRGKGRSVVTELADLMEIIDAILTETKIKFSELRKIQKEKRIKRGGFKKKLFLIKTTKVTNENN